MSLLSENVTNKSSCSAYKYVTSTYRPMECLHIDFIGPYPDKGYVLVITDCFTRWVELYAAPEATAHEACLCLIQHFGRYGSPTIIRSDKGSHFANELIAQFLAAAGTLQSLTLAYSSQENAIIESNDKEINRHLRLLTFHTNTVDNYQLGLPFVQRIMNSSHNERTDIAPFQILFGNSVDLDRGILTPFEEILPKSISLTKTSGELLSLQQQYITIAQEILQKSDAEQISKNSAQVTEFAPNTFVLVQQHTTPETRLHTLWRGPMKVIESIKGQYTLLI
jgi:transposase InsO family protein